MKTVVGTLKSRSEAELAVERLQAIGIAKDHINMSTRYSAHLPDPLAKRSGNGNRNLGLALREQVVRKKSDLTARDLMTTCLVTVRPEDSIERAARLMSESDCGAVPVVDATGRLLGIITNRDITRRLVARGLSIPHAQVSDCMTSEAFACSADNSVDSCMLGMSWHKVRCFPIVDDEHRVIGMISQGDLARYVFEHPEERGAIAEILWALAY